MGASALMQFASHKILGKSNPADRAVAAINKYTAAPPIPTIPTLPDPPSTLNAAADAANAMTAAANRYRKQRGGGFGSTILTGPLGSTTPAPTARKSLLGQ